MRPSEPSTARPGVALLLLFLLLGVGIVAAGALYYRSYERHFRAEVEKQLSAIADLKAGELVKYRQERLGDARLLFQNPSFTALVRRFFEQPADADALRQLQDRLGPYLAVADYEQVRLVDAQGVSRLTIPAGRPQPSAYILQRSREVLASKQVELQDFYRSGEDQRVYLAVLVPLLDARDARPPLGVLILRLDPEKFLYPFIKRWPVPSRSAETLLVRKDGNDALFLNELRFQTNTALNLRTPLDRVTMPAVQAALGREGLFDGIDYRGVPVLAALRTIPDSPWAMVARMDNAEVYGPLRAHLWQVVVIIGALLFGAGAGVGLLWRHQHARFYREQYQMSEAMRVSEIQYRRLFEAARDGILILDAETGMVVDVNPYLIELLGVTREVFLGKKVWELGFFKDLVANEANFAELKEKKYIRYEDMALEGFDGKRHEVEFVSNVYLVNQHPVIQCNIRDISERVRAEAELDRINNLLAEGQRIAHVGSWEYRAETQDTLWSEEQLRIYGLNPAGPSPDYQVLLRRCIHPEDAARLDETFRQCLQDRAVFALEHRLVRPDGIVRVVQELARPFSDDHGRLVKYVGVTLDITERKQAEEALAIRFRVAYIFSTLHEEEMFHEVLKLILDVLRSPFGVFGYLDEAGALVVPTMTRQIWDKCQVPDKTFIFPRATWGDSSWPRAVREKQANYSNAVSAKTPAGHVTLTRHICLPILFQGEVIGLFQVANKATDYTAADLGTLEAIAAQVAPLLSARLLRERAQKTLHREKEFARAVLDNIGDGVVACDAQGTLVLFNRTAREWHGMDALALPPGEWGRHFDLYGPDGTTPLPTDSIPLVRAFRGETVHDAGMAIVAQGQPPRYIQADGRPFYDAQQNLLGAVVAMHDISQRKQAESAIRQLNESLEKRVVERTAQLAIANQELEAFSYSVSHDLRAPLRALDGFSAALLEDCAGKLDAAAQEHLRRIRAGSQRMGVLIDDLLHLSRESRAAMRSEHVDLTALAHEIGAELQRTQPDRRMEWVVAPVLAAHGDARMLRVVLNNLLGNAWKYTGKRDGARIEVGVTVGPLPSAGGTPSAASGDAAYNGAVFFVRDNGAGFDMAYAGKLFGAFQRLHTLAEFPGSGIGLALVQRIIHRHGGRVWAEGAVGQGATFYFTLPGSAVEDNLGTHRP